MDGKDVLWSRGIDEPLQQLTVNRTPFEIVDIPWSPPVAAQGVPKGKDGRKGGGGIGRG